MKKEAYLNPQNTSQKIEEWKHELTFIKSHYPFSLDPSQVALLVLDMQDVFLNSDSHAFIPSSPTIVSNIQKLIAEFHSRDNLVIFTRHLSSENERDIMHLWWRTPILERDFSSFLTKKLDSSKSKIIQKNQYSAFHSTELNSILQSKNIKQVIIAGVMTHLCCETTARAAFMNGYQVFFAMDATASYTEQLHLGTLRSITHGFGRCLSTKEIITAMHP